MTQLWPGATIGIVGGGQLARMMALEARRMGYRVAVLDPDPDGPAGQIADRCIAGALDDRTALEALAAQCDVITLDTEHVPADLLAGIEARNLVRPGSNCLRIVQDRGDQRRLLEALHAPQTSFAQVSDLPSLQAAAMLVGAPCVLKTRRSGYDGRGQVRVDSVDDLASAWATLGSQPCIVEGFVDFEKEISILLARGVTGEIRFYPVAENVHRHHILHTTRAPASIPPALVTEAQELGARIAVALQYVGVLAVELFVTRQGKLLVNEVAPRPHNSGHYTFGACVTSQFEQHVRAVCGLTLGDTTLVRPAAMLNLLGKHWSGGAPDWETVLVSPSARLHLYGKKLPSPSRKMGHVLVVSSCDQDATDATDAMDAIDAIERALVQAATPIAPTATQS